MPSVNDFPSRGRVIEVSDDTVVFQPTGTNYQLYLRARDTKYAGPVDLPVECLIRASARKVWTVPSGGAFIAPIFGPPRIIQGRVKHLEGREMVVHAGTPIVVELPAAESAIDPARGPVVEGALVNVTALPGATFELLEPAAQR
jgi:hypothetical protein